MSRIRILSKRQGSPLAQEGEVVIDVDRTNAVLGNPYILHDHRNDIERNQVIASYGQKLEDDWASHGPMRKSIELLSERVNSGVKIALRCWCAPRRCHADLLAVKIEEMAHVEHIPPSQKFKNKQMNLF